MNVVLICCGCKVLSNFNVGNQRYTGVNYSGVLHVNSDEGIDYIGIVFGYQSNKKFYVIMWRHENNNLYNDTYKAGIKGIQIKVSMVSIYYG